MEKYKLKHLSKFCCKPANELEFEDYKWRLSDDSKEVCLVRE